METVIIKCPRCDDSGEESWNMGYMYSLSKEDNILFFMRNTNIERDQIISTGTTWITKCSLCKGSCLVHVAPARIVAES